MADTDTPAGHAQNVDQIAYWNGPGGQRWADRQQVQDAMLAPVSAILLDRARVVPGERIIDVGCGCGATTRALAEKVGAAGHVLGIDISAPMLRTRQATHTEGRTRRIPACRRHRASVRAGNVRSDCLPVWRDVLCGTGGVVR